MRMGDRENLLKTAAILFAKWQIRMRLFENQSFMHIYKWRRRQQLNYHLEFHPCRSMNNLPVEGPRLTPNCIEVRRIFYCSMEPRPVCTETVSPFGQ